jgi:hypothetical protein
MVETIDPNVVLTEGFCEFFTRMGYQEPHQRQM